VLTAVLQVLVFAGCSHNLHPETSRTTTCEAFGLGSASTWHFLLVVCAPALSFVASQLVPRLRRRPLPTATVVAACATIVRLLAIAVATGDVLAD
jgi:hypothetical protein